MLHNFFNKIKKIESLLQQQTFKSTLINDLHFLLAHSVFTVPCICYFIATHSNELRGAKTQLLSIIFAYFFFFLALPRTAKRGHAHCEKGSVFKKMRAGRLAHIFILWNICRCVCSRHTPKIAFSLRFGNYTLN